MEWITIKIFTFPQEAYIAQSILEAEGIPTFLKDEMAVQVHNFYSQAIQGVKLQVPDAYVREAYEILVDSGYIVQESGKAAPETFADPRYETECPYCASDNVDRQKQAGYTWLAAMALIGIAAPVYKYVYRCFDCRKEWRISAKR